MKPINTFGEVIKQVEENYSEDLAFNFLSDGHWNHISTESFIFDLKRLTLGLVSMGLKRGDNVGILAKSSPFWTMADFAIIIAGGVSVPIFDKISDVNLIFEVAQANIRFIFMEGEKSWKLFDEHRHLFETVIALDKPMVEGKNIVDFYDILKKGEEYWKENPELFDQLIDQQKADDVATIIYTSGVTGMPKGVELTHRNLTHLINYDVYSWKKKLSDSYLSVLPLAHVFARQINIIIIAWGIPLYYLNDMSRFAKVCKALKPGLMIVVPRLLEKMYEGMQMMIVKQKNALIKKFINWAFNLANTPAESLIKKYLLMPIADFLVYRKIRKFFGGKWRVILCGGAALNSELYQFYLNIGFPIYEGWGLTEASTAAVNQPGRIKVGTVGPNLPGIKIKLGKNDEVLVGGPTVMKGYYRHPDATSAVIDNEGWLHTGDKGEIDKKGFLTLTGRIKEQFKLSSGEYVSPSRIEEALNLHPLMYMAAVVGNRRKFVTALFFPDVKYLKLIKKQQKADNLSDEEFLSSPYIQEEMNNLIEKISSKLNVWEKIVKYRFILAPLTVEGGEITPTLQLIRDTVLERFKDEIEEMYTKEQEEDK